MIMHRAYSPRMHAPTKGLSVNRIRFCRSLQQRSVPCASFRVSVENLESPFYLRCGQNGLSQRFYYRLLRSVYPRGAAQTWIYVVYGQVVSMLVTMNTSTHCMSYWTQFVYHVAGFLETSVVISSLGMQAERRSRSRDLIRQLKSAVFSVCKTIFPIPITQRRSQSPAFLLDKLIETSPSAGLGFVFTNPPFSNPPAACSSEESANIRDQGRPGSRLPYEPPCVAAPM